MRWSQGRRGWAAELCAISVLWSAGCFVTDRTPPQISSPNTIEDAGAAPDTGPQDECPTDGAVRECTREHAVGQCQDGGCALVGCIEPYSDCDRKSENGCETALDTPENCGSCGSVCTFQHAGAKCQNGACGLGDCEDHYGNCDGDPDNGCETPLTTLSDCGGCKKTCSALPEAVVDCSGGTCGVGSCSRGFGDCNHQAADGCEQNLDDVRHCGACDHPCVPANAAPGTCTNGMCLVTKCNGGFADCNGLAADGCETRLDGAENCGACGVSCRLPHVTSPSCEKLVDGYRCVVEHDCDSDTASCAPIALQTNCDKGYADCDRNAANGCEADLSRLDNCGTCGNGCVRAGSINECREGRCIESGCRPGYATCEGTVCRWLGTDPRNCGACGQTCGATSMCAGGKCTAQVCTSGRADCDGEQSNGCEVSLVSAENCGLCGQRCPNRPHASAACQDGLCGIGACDAGWKDCDGDPSNGCEIDVRTNNDCGDCEKACIASNATTQCSSDGECQITRCSDGRGNCNSTWTDGCEADFSLPAHCGSCNNPCTGLMDTVSSSCATGVCNLVCGPGHADCNGRAADGCEADLTSDLSCGACGNNCTMLMNASSAKCVNGTCRELSCAVNTQDCNGNPADGCEASLQTALNCGACNRPCAPPHASGDCASGTCKLGACEAGFADCNGNPADGCEQSLNDRQHCGACNAACANGVDCNNGSCACKNNGDCEPDTECCDGRCAHTKSACFVWPCMPGTELPNDSQNCGGCGMACIFCCKVTGDAGPSGS